MPDSNEQASSQICMKSPWDLRKYKFRISPYQRGYRWCTRQVQDLLNDLYAFAAHHSGTSVGNGGGGSTEWSGLDLLPEELRAPFSLIISHLSRNAKETMPVYVLQPLMVSNREDDVWEVVDGQQRLTTLLVILYCLGAPQRYTIWNKSGENLEVVLRALDEERDLQTLAEKLQSDLDTLHLYLALKIVRKRLDENKEVETALRNLLRDKYRARVKFIWYEIPDGVDAVKEFVNINTGRIALTQTELVKALILRRSPSVEDYQQLTTALQWEQMENALSAHDFWFFISNNSQQEIPVHDRISLILRIAAAQLEQGTEPVNEDELFSRMKRISGGKVKTQREKTDSVWETVLSVFRTLEHWYVTPELYNWVGFLIHRNKKNQEKKLYELVKAFADKGAAGFRDYLVKEVKSIISRIDVDNLDYNSNSDEILQVLLFLNILMLNKSQTGHLKKGLGRSPSYKFPFNLYAEERWDIEHVDSRTDDMDAMLEQTLDFCQESGETWFKQEELAELETARKNKDYEKAMALLQKKDYMDSVQNWPDDKDGIQNLALLPASINRSYGNVIFAMKRNTIRERIETGAFVPLCTQLVFTKSYNDFPKTMIRWEYSDKELYKAYIKKQIADFINQA